MHTVIMVLALGGAAAVGLVFYPDISTALRQMKSRKRERARMKAREISKAAPRDP